MSTANGSGGCTATTIRARDVPLTRAALGEPVCRRLDELAVLAGTRGQRVWLVAGAIRDALIGREGSGDVDLAVEGDAPGLARAWAERLGVEVKSHDRFSTATLTLPEGLRFDLAGTRRERYAHPSALPTVEPAPLAEDLWRRDFTLNSLAVEWTGPDAPSGDLVDPTGGLADLTARRLRFLHARSFVDDPTRIWRGLRYAIRFRLGFEGTTWRAARAAVRDGALERPSEARLRRELRALAAEPTAGRLGGWLEALGLLERPGDAAAFPRATELAAELGPAPDDGVDGWHREVLSALLAETLRSDTLRRAVSGRSRDVAGPDPLLASASLPAAPGTLHARLSGLPDAPLVAHAGRIDAPSAEALATYVRRRRTTRLDIDGTTLEGQGIPRGPALGRGLRAALAAKLDTPGLDAAAQLAVAVRAARS